VPWHCFPLPRGWSGLWCFSFGWRPAPKSGGALLARHVRGLAWKKNLPYGIGKRRTLKFSGTAMLSAILRMAMFKYSEIFFLAFAAGTTVAGVYDLGYSLPFTVVTFIPLALLSLFTAAFAEAYVKDRNCLGRLISSYYKLLIMVSLPVAVPGAFFSPAAYHIIYKGEMDEAGLIASAFCIVLLLPLISIPLSTALKAKEKAHNMLPMMMFQIAVNLFLDWLLIVNLHLGLWGGVGAVAGTFFLTIVPRLMVARRLIGGIYFPGRFFLRIVSALVLEAAAFFWITRQVKLFEIFEDNWVNTVFALCRGNALSARLSAACPRPAPRAPIRHRRLPGHGNPPPQQVDDPAVRRVIRN